MLARSRYTQCTKQFHDKAAMFNQIIKSQVINGLGIM